MKTLTVPIPDWNHTLPRVVVLCLAVAGLGLATWYGMQPRPADDGGSFVEGQPTPSSNGYPGGYPNGYNEQTQAIVYRDRAASDGQCSQWDISPVAMEAILQEMLRRGWKPPTQGEAIASIAPVGSQMTAIDPNAPLPVFTRPIAPPAETAVPEEGVVSDPSLPVTTPSPTTPATTAPTTRPPAANPSRPPAAQPPAATPPRTAPPVATTPRPQVTQPLTPPRPATPPAATPPAAAPVAPPIAPPTELADPT
jgi:hypothetical protein